MIYTKKLIRCDECNYEEPNDYYYGVKTWLFVTSDCGVVYHFCSNKCMESYDNPKIKFIRTSKLESNSQEMRNILL